MSGFVAALPMYDWPEARAETDAEWERLRSQLRGQGLEAPKQLARRNADLPPVPGGIRAADGQLLVPDPAAMPPDALDLRAVWLHPRLLLAQTCWGPLQQGLERHVRVVGQPDYSAYEGGEGAFYSSALLMRDGGSDVAAPADGRALLPLERLAGVRFAFNGPDSMSGILALTNDLENSGRGLDLFSGRVETGSHRASLRAVAEGDAELCAVDCRSWALARRFEPAAARLTVVGWTRRRLGLPYITALGSPAFRLP